MARKQARNQELFLLYSHSTVEVLLYVFVRVRICEKYLTLVYWPVSIIRFVVTVCHLSKNVLPDNRGVSPISKKFPPRQIMFSGI